MKRAECRDGSTVSGGGKPRRNYPPARPSGCQPVSAGRETALSQSLPLATTGKLRATKLDSSGSAGSMEPAARRLATGPLSGARSGPLPVQAKPGGKIHRLHRRTSREQGLAAQLRWGWSGVWRGSDPNEGANAGVDSSAPHPTEKKGLSGGKRREGREVVPQNSLPPSEIFISVLILDLFKYLSTAKLYSVEWQDYQWIMNWKRHEGKRIGIIQGTVPHLSRGAEKNLEKPPLL
jgi:hypothetical protein